MISSAISSSTIATVVAEPMFVMKCEMRVNRNVGVVVLS